VPLKDRESGTMLFWTMTESRMISKTEVEDGFALLKL